MILLDKYLYEKSHIVNGTKVNGTAARIAMSNAGTSMKNKSLKDIQTSLNHIFDSFRLSVGTNNITQAKVRETITKNISKHKSFLKELEEKYNSMDNTDNDKGLVKKYILAVKSIIKTENRYLSNTSDVKSDLTNRTRDDIIKDLQRIKNQYKSESCSNVNNTKLAIYEAYDAGIITESEKSDLLTILESDNSTDIKH